MDDNNSVPQTIEIWDEADALKRIMGQEAILKLLVDAFLTDMPVYAKDLSESLGKENLAEAAKHAHAIKGAAGNLSTFAIAEKAKEIEHICLENGSVNRLGDLHQDFKVLLVKTLETLDTWQKAKA